MYTQCPECGTVFRVTAAVLRAARGHVRCGVCDASFDSLGYLTDGVDADPADRARPAGQPLADDPPRTVEPVGVGAAYVEPPAPSVAVSGFKGDSDEPRMLAAIAASIAAPLAAPIAAPIAPVTETPTLARSGDEPGEANVLEPTDVEDIILSGDTNDPDLASDAALEFNLPADHWDQVFVEDRYARTITPLDLNLEPSDEPPTSERPPDMGDATSDHLRALHEFDDPLARTLPPLDGHLEPPEEPPTSERPPDMGVETSDHLRALHEFDDPLARTDSWEMLSQRDAESAAADHDALEQAADDATAGEPAAGRGDVSVPTLEANAHESGHDAMSVAAHEPGASAVLGAAVGAVAAHRVNDAKATPPSELPPPPWTDADFAREFGRPIAQDQPAWMRPAAIAAIGVLALGLAAQAIDFFRVSLVGAPLIGAPLAQLYARLGRSVEPTWNLSAYDVKQWGAESGATPGGLRLRVSVINRAARGQPYPLLRVTLEDRFGGKVARREFAPAEYLPGRSPPQGLLAPGARVDADLSLADPGSQAVGFELDVCLPREGALACGNDPTLAGG